MDHPVLHAFVDQLRAHERFQGFAQALPTRARASEPILPLLLAALHEELTRPVVCLLPADEDARDAAEAAGWFLNAGQVALEMGNSAKIVMDHYHEVVDAKTAREYWSIKPIPRTDRKIVAMA